MDSGKRASMREGPLAALFRRTDEEGAQEERRPERKPKKKPAAEHKPVTGRPFPAAPSSEVEEHTDELRPAPPSARVEHAEPRPARTPEQRLREVFAADIPENIMERTPTRAPVHDEYRGRYGREEPVPMAVPAPMLQPVLRVVGVGGAGVNAVNRMIEAGVEGVDFIAINTDLQSLQQSSAHTTLHIGSEVTRGLGSCSNPELGRQAALEEYDEIKAQLKGSDMVFITAGSGGGTGTGAAPVVARIARELGALTVGIVTKPFSFEGSRRGEQAGRGGEELWR